MGSGPPPEPGDQIDADDRVAELARTAGRAAVDPSAEHDPASDAGADRQHHEVVGDKPQLLVVGLGEGRDGRVVVDEHGQAEPIPEDLPQRHVGQRHVDRRHHASGFELDDRRDADADGLEVVDAGRLEHVDELVDQRIRTRTVGPCEHRLAKLAIAQRRQRDLGAPQIDADHPHVRTITGVPRPEDRATRGPPLPPPAGTRTAHAGSARRLDRRRPRPLRPWTRRRRERPPSWRWRSPGTSA